jgi:hypothetical protein
MGTRVGCEGSTDPHGHRVAAARALLAAKVMKAPEASKAAEGDEGWWR